MMTSAEHQPDFLEVCPEIKTEMDEIRARIEGLILELKNSSPDLSKISAEMASIREKATLVTAKTDSKILEFSGASLGSRPDLYKLTLEQISQRKEFSLVKEKIRNEEVKQRSADFSERAADTAYVGTLSGPRVGRTHGDVYLTDVDYERPPSDDELIVAGLLARARRG